MVPALVTPKTPFHPFTPFPPVTTFPPLPTFISSFIPPLDPLPTFSPTPRVNKQTDVYIYASLVAIFFVIFGAVWRIKRRNRVKKIIVASVIIIPNRNQHNLQQEGALNIRKQKIVVKSQKNNNSVSIISLPREPTNSQENPAHLVPSTAHPDNFDRPNLTTTTTTITQQNAPNQTDARQPPTPANNAPMTRFNTHQTRIPNMPLLHGQTSYQATGQMPYPPATYQSNDYSANPPPYEVVVTQPPIQPHLAKESNGKQASHS